MLPRIALRIVHFGQDFIQISILKIADGRQSSSKPQNYSTPNVRKLMLRFTISQRRLTLVYRLILTPKDKWSQLEYLNPFYDYKNNSVTIEQLATLVAYQCINARGAIAHGKVPAWVFGETQVLETLKSEKKGVKATFNERGGCKILDSVMAIKEELFANGPVVSVSFAFQHEDANYYTHLSDLIALKALLIVGWKASSVGEVWLVQPLSPAAFFQKATLAVTMGQFGIARLCLAPTNNFENMAWEPGPYLDIASDFANVEVWQSWAGIDTSVTMEQYMKLIKQLGKVSY